MNKYVSRLILSSSIFGTLCAASHALAEPSELKTAEIILPGTEALQEITYEIVDGEAIYQGDIVLGEVDEDGNIIGADEFSTESLIKRSSGSKWPGGVIPYYLNNALSSFVVSDINDAIFHWESNTPIDFVPYNSSVHNAYVHFTTSSDNSICGNSKVGRQGGEQKIHLVEQPGCHTGTVIHEIGHAVGLHHEQSRSDRDVWVDIKWANIDFLDEHNFQKHSGSAADSGYYDYLSIMHYSKGAFSNNGQDTIIPLQPLPPGGNIGQRLGLSDGDIAAVTALYSLTKSGVNFDDAMCPEETVCKMGDVNGDGHDDIVNFYRGEPTIQIPGGAIIPNPDYAKVYVSLANSEGFADRQLWLTEFCVGNQQCEVADMDKDRKADILVVGGGVSVARSTGSGFNTPHSIHPDACSDSGEICQLGDFNGDGWTDVLTFKNGAANSIDVYVYQNKIKWLLPNIWNWEREVALVPRNAAQGFCMQSEEFCTTGDFNGDGMDDIITFHHGAWNNSNQVFVYLSDGRNFNYTGTPWMGDFCDSTQTCMVADINGDGADDVLAFEGTVFSDPPNPVSPELSPFSGDVYVAYSNGGNGFEAPVLLNGHMCLDSKLCFAAQMDSDPEDEFIDLDQGAKFDYR